MADMCNISAEDIEVLQLKLAGFSQDQMAARTRIPETTVNRKLKKWRGIIGEDVMKVLEKSGRAVRKGNDDQPLASPKEFGDLLDSMEDCKESNISTQESREYIKWSLAECKADGIDPKRIWGTSNAMAAEAAKQGKAILDVASDFDATIKEGKVVDAELTSKKQEAVTLAGEINKAKKYKPIEDELVKRGIDSVLLDSAKTVNFIQNIAQNDYNVERIAFMMAETDSTKKDTVEAQNQLNKLKETYASAIKVNKEKETEPELQEQNVSKRQEAVEKREKEMKEENEMHLRTIEKLRSDCEFYKGKRKSLHLQDLFDPISEDLAGGNECPKEYVRNFALIALALCKKRFPRHFSCRPSLEAAEYSLRNDFSLGVDPFAVLLKMEVDQMEEDVPHRKEPLKRKVAPGTQAMERRDESNAVKAEEPKVKGVFSELLKSNETFHGWLA